MISEEKERMMTNEGLIKLYTARAMHAREADRLQLYVALVMAGVAAVIMFCAQRAS